MPDFRDHRENPVASLTFEHAKQHSTALQGLPPCSGVFFLSPLSTIIDSTGRMTTICVLRSLSLGVCASKYIPIKTFRAQLRGIRDVKYFLFRLKIIYA